MGSGSPFCCPFCPCSFASQHDLDLHLKVFGRVSHVKLLRDCHVSLESGDNAYYVDEHGCEPIPIYWGYRVYRKWLKRMEHKRHERRLDIEKEGLLSFSV